MEFTRKKKKGEKQKVRRFWFSPEGYRIIWRCEVHGVQVPGRYQSAVRTTIPNYSGTQGQSFEMWDFADPKHRLFKVLGKAQESCERHQRLWEKACEATGVRGLMELFGGKLPIGIPVWAKKKLPCKLLEILTRPQNVKYRDEDDECEPSPDGPTRTLDCSAGPTEPVTSVRTPALPAKVKDSVTIPSTKATKSSAPSAKEPAKAQRKRAAKPTAKRSPATTKKRKPTTRSSKPAKKPAKDSPKNKSKRSKS